MVMPQVVLFAVALLALAGNLFVIRRRRLGFVCWALADVVLIAHNLAIHEWAQAALFFAYLGMAIWGISSWKKIVVR